MNEMKHPNDRLPFWKNARFHAGSLSTALLCIALAVLVALNLLMTSLEKKHGWRVDFSFNALTTQSETTLDVLAALEHPVHIYALYSRGSEDQPLLELLDRYASASPLVTWEQADVSTNPGLIARFSATAADTAITNDSLIVYCEDTGRWKVLSQADFISLSFDYEAGAYAISGLTYESSITSAISYVDQAEVPRAMILQGHGELDEDATGVLASLLAVNNYDVGYFTLSSEEAALSPEDLLIILSPQRDLMPDELEKITDFAANGGSILFAVDYSDPTDRMPNFAALLRSYGFVHRPGLVLASPEETGTYYNNNRIYLIPYMQATEITLPLVSARTNTLLLTGSAAFEMPEDSTDRALTVEAVLTSGYKAYLHDVSTGTVTQDDEDPVGPFALALQARRVTDAGYVSRAFVLGCSTLLTSSEVYAMTDSQEFIVRMVQYLLDQQPVSNNIMARAAIRPALTAGSVTLGAILLVALPVFVLVAALAVLLPRRGK